MRYLISIHPTNHQSHAIKICPSGGIIKHKQVEPYQQVCCDQVNSSSQNQKAVVHVAGVLP